MYRNFWSWARSSISRGRTHWRRRLLRARWRIRGGLLMVIARWILNIISECSWFTSRCGLEDDMISFGYESRLEVCSSSSLRVPELLHYLVSFRIQFSHECKWMYFWTFWWIETMHFHSLNSNWIGVIQFGNSRRSSENEHWNGWWRRGAESSAGHGK